MDRPLFLEVPDDRTSIEDKVAATANRALQERSLDEHTWSFYLDNLTRMPLTPIEDASESFMPLTPLIGDRADLLITPILEPRDESATNHSHSTKRTRSPIHAEGPVYKITSKQQKRWNEDELELLKTAPSAREAVDRLGTKNHPERSIRTKWCQIQPKTKKQAHNAWKDGEIEVLTKAPSSREAITRLGTKNHSEHAIRRKWSLVQPKDKKQVQNIWKDEEIEVLIKAPSSREAITRLGTKNHPKLSIRKQWYRLQLQAKNKEG